MTENPHPQEAHESWVADRSRMLRHADTRIVATMYMYEARKSQPFPLQRVSEDGDVVEVTVGPNFLYGMHKIKKSLYDDLKNCGEQDTANEVLDHNREEGVIYLAGDEEKRNDTPY